MVRCGDACVGKREIERRRSSHTLLQRTLPNNEKTMGEGNSIESAQSNATVPKEQSSLSRSEVDYLTCSGEKGGAFLVRRRGRLPDGLREEVKQIPGVILPGTYYDTWYTFALPCSPGSTCLRR